MPDLRALGFAENRLHDLTVVAISLRPFGPLRKMINERAMKIICIFRAPWKEEELFRILTLARIWN